LGVRNLFGVQCTSIPKQRASKRYGQSFLGSLRKTPARTVIDGSDKILAQRKNLSLPERNI
jgi:hypothetical protein